MAKAVAPAADLLKTISDGIGQQIKDLTPGNFQQISVDAIVQELNNLAKQVAPLANGTIDTLLTDIINAVVLIQNGTKTQLDFGPILGDLDTIEQLLLAKGDAVSNDILASVIAQLNGILNYRPDVASILGDLNSIKSLKGGPSDATAFHDFHVLQIAFKHIWMQAFDQNVSGLVAQAYHQFAQLYDDLDVEMPALDDINDIQSLNSFISAVKTATGATDPGASGTISSGSGGVIVPPPPSLGTRPSPLPIIPKEVLQTFPGAATLWYLLSVDQQSQIQTLSTQYPSQDSYVQSQTQKAVQEIINYPQGNATRLTQLILELGKALEEPYAFDIFAPNSYNFGLMLTYRQEWEPQEYQAGNLVATIPLAPGETRKYTHKQIVKKSVSQKEAEKSSSTRSEQSSQTSRAEADIMQKATNNTSFKLNTHGSFNIGIGEMDTTTEFSTNQQAESVSNKKNFHEATVKAAEEYRTERNTEITSSSSTETEDTTSGEISNPNNEITVTYLFYELQRRYLIRETLYKVQPVILVAQEVPLPHEIDEAWLIEHQWIIRRVLLDDSFKEALDYLTSGLAGDEVSVQVIKAHWEDQESLTKSLESQVQNLLYTRDNLRNLIVNSTKQEDVNDARASLTSFDPVNFFLNPYSAINKVEDFAGNAQSNDMIEANRKAAKTRLEYTEQALSAMQDRLQQATDSYQKATDQYSAALQKQFSRNVAIDQLRIHVKQNILFYMQAVWAHEDPDQRFFRLYNLPVTTPTPGNLSSITATGVAEGVVNLEATLIGSNYAEDEIDLVDIAEIDTPLGYKGNYIIFPLKQQSYLTLYMTQEFISDDFSLQDPDQFSDLRNFPSIDGPGGAGEYMAKQIAAAGTADEKKQLAQHFADYVNSSQNGAEIIIVPTGQLFIEALPGSHPLLEDFKLLHRAEDVLKVKAEVRHAELENLRLATRLVQGQNKDQANLLEDPDIEKKITVEGNAKVNVDSN